MRVIVREKVNAIATPETKVYHVSVDTISNRDAIPSTIGLAKGDMIVFRGNGDPVRFPTENINGRIMVTDNTSDTGWSLIPNSSGSGSTVTLTNATGDLVLAGTVVKIQSDYDFIKATSADTSMLFVTADNCDPNDDVACYSTVNAVCSILCTSDAVSVNDKLAVSSTDGLAESTAGDGFAIALSAKASGSTGLVDAILIQNGFLPLTGGTLSGNLELGNVRIHANSSDIDEDVAPGSTVYYAPYEFYDKDGNLIGHIEMHQDANNKIGMNLGIRRKISGTWTWKQAKFSIDTSGNWTWDFGDASAARNALGLGNTSGALPIANGGTGQTTVASARNALGLGNTSGAVPVANGGTGATNASSARTNLGFSMSVTNKYDYSDVSLANNTDTELGTFSLTAGTYILRISASFASNNAGYRQLHLYNKTDSAEMGYIWDTMIKATDGGRTTFGITNIIQISSTKTYAIKGKQNSGSTIAVSPRYQYLKII